MARFTFEATKPTITDAEFLEDLRRVAVQLGCESLPQRRYREHGRYSTTAIKDRFGSWNKAVAAAGLVAAGERDIPEEHLHENVEASPQQGPALAVVVQPSGRGPRDPSLKLRFLVMRRDRFCCRHCGSSPAKDLGVELHVDHIVPWSRGGTTTMENLQTLCTRCNLGKSDLHES